MGYDKGLLDLPAFVFSQLSPSSRTPGLSIVVPAFRSANSLVALVEALQCELPKLCDSYEVIFVEDGGGDDTWDVIKGLVAQHATLRGIRLSRNSGQHAALLCGIRQARLELVVTMDDDLQNPPREIGSLLAAMTNDVDVVYGVPTQPEHSWWRLAASRITYAVVLGGQAQASRRAEGLSAFRLFRTRLRAGFENDVGTHPSIDVLLSWTTTRMVSTRVDHAARVHGTSTYSFRKLVTHAVTMFTGFSTVPLHIASAMGFLFSAFGFVLLAWVLANYFAYGVAPAGFTFLASMLSLFAGIQLIVLGIIGEYVARIYFRSMRQPSYVIAEDTRDV